ncbi:hypothetical protein Golomagni_07668 [Golovinomyces magnicellulatus]|nr:hypothetical protein Golomagni_07668 [Golovinomyces magnicellulatus]
MDPAHRRRRLRHPLATCPRSGAPALQASASARSARKRSTCSWAQSTSRISRSSLVSARLIAAAETASRFADAIFLAPLAPPIHQRVASNDRRPHLPARNQVSSYLEQGVRTRRLGHGSAQRDQRGTRHREPRVGAHLPGTQPHKERPDTDRCYRRFDPAALWQQRVVSRSSSSHPECQQRRREPSRMRSCDAARTSVCRPSCGTLDSSDSSARSTASRCGHKTRLAKSRCAQTSFALADHLTDFCPLRSTDSHRKKLWRRKDDPPFEYPWKETGTA